ncbi:hypothetical protein BZA05DRAFT_80685 [Tricharina praecox]|uniref:uncharacterized protein n=1 Tax=Tricharina praecox TaxID=43433 RepID=UPI002220B63C|nr:uncharacterized protein BZA05DRAFT_80685 [Tricharina praecox]KAI5849017.1 hypothetical protein BZA05DRAFT_80685 [Tricharina praecox]
MSFYPAMPTVHGGENREVTIGSLLYVFIFVCAAAAAAAGERSTVVIRERIARTERRTHTHTHAHTGCGTTPIRPDPRRRNSPLHLGCFFPSFFLLESFLFSSRLRAAASPALVRELAGIEIETKQTGLREREREKEKDKKRKKTPSLELPGNIGVELCSCGVHWVL